MKRAKAVSVYLSNTDNVMKWKASTFGMTDLYLSFQVSEKDVPHEAVDEEESRIGDKVPRMEDIAQHPYLVTAEPSIVCLIHLQCLRMNFGTDQAKNA